MILQGIRVVDFSQYIPGSYTSWRLARLGAEVIKVEPLTGDPTRYFGETPEDEGIVFTANNAQKKSIALNLKSIEGQELAIDLIKKADVVIESFRHGVMERLGLSYPQLLKYKKGLIYCSLSGYGQSGVMTEFGSHDLNYQSLSGVLSKLKDSAGKPILSKITLADKVGGITASERIIGALLYRERTGEGQYLDISLMDSIVEIMNLNLLAVKKVAKDNVIPQLTGKLVSYNIYETKDGRFVSLAALEQKFWERFCLAVDRPEWLDAHQSRQSVDNPVYLQLRELFLSRTFAEWTQFSLAVDCCLSPVLEVSEVSSHPFFQDKSLIDLNNEPRLGEHTDLIIKELLKRTEAELAILRKKNVIR